MEGKLTVSIFIGSIRENNKAVHVSAWLKSVLEKKDYMIHLIDPAKYKELLVLSLPNHYNQNPSDEMKLVSGWLKESDGFLLVTPEYNHSFSGAIKNALDNFMPEYEKKPFGIISYSSGPFAGVRANEALRTVVSELKGVPTPIPLMISKINDVFDEKGELKDLSLIERSARFLANFEWYVKALKLGRETIK